MRHATYGVGYQARAYATLALMLIGLGALAASVVEALAR